MSDGERLVNVKEVGVLIKELGQEVGTSSGACQEDYELFPAGSGGHVTVVHVLYSGFSMMKEVGMGENDVREDKSQSSLQAFFSPLVGLSPTTQKHFEISNKLKRY